MVYNNTLKNVILCFMRRKLDNMVWSPGYCTALDNNSYRGFVLVVRARATRIK